MLNHAHTEIGRDRGRKELREGKGRGGKWGREGEHEGDEQKEKEGRQREGRHWGRVGGERKSKGGEK